MYKKKLDQIYDLCTSCKAKLKVFLQKQNQQIGDYYLQKKRKAPLAEHLKQQPQLGSAASSVNACSNNNINPMVANRLASVNHKSKANGELNGSTLTNGIKSMSMQQQQQPVVTVATSPAIFESTFQSNFTSVVRKAHTIAGSVPYFMSSLRQRDVTSKMSNMAAASSPLTESNSKLDNSINDVSMTYTPSPPASPMQASPQVRSGTRTVPLLAHKESETGVIPSGSLGLIVEDSLVLAFSLLVFICDLINLINDSDAWSDDQSFAFKSDDFTWFQFFLNVYQYVALVLFANFVMSMHLVYKRCKFLIAHF